MEENYACENNTKRKLCARRCSTCYKRSFASVKIWKILHKDFLDPVLFKPSTRWSEKNTENPKHVLKCSNSKYIFDCSECGHDFRTNLADCTLRNRWCPFCAGKKLCTNGYCDYCFEKSAASLPRIRLFSEENKRQGLEDDPRMIRKYSHKQFFFDCEDCGHPYKKRLDSFTRNERCGYCYGDLLCENSGNPEINPRACNFCFRKSFASHPRAKDIADDEDFDPCFVRKHSNIKVSFLCSEKECKGKGHYFLASLDNVSRQNGTWCPFCCNPPKEICEDCDTCFAKSFASSSFSKYIDYDGMKGIFIDPKTLLKSSHTKIPFVCNKKDCGNKFKMSPNAITNGNKWCPHCKKKTEAKMMKWLQKRFPGYKIKREWKPCLKKEGFECKNPDTGRNLPFDFYIPELKLIIEIDGPQHFVQVHNWKSPEETKKIDLYKEGIVTINGLSIIRLLQTDVYYDKHAWEENLNIALTDDNYHKDTPGVIKIYEGEIIHCTFGF